MKQTFFILITLIFYIQNTTAQNNADYNSKGDQSLEKSDYLDACMWYGEGIEKCDDYSIHQLTRIWNDQPSIRTSIHILMSKSLNCLEKKAISNDMESMILLSEYYEKGIGTEINLSQSELWKKKVLNDYAEEKNTVMKIPVTDTIKPINSDKPEILKKPLYADLKYFLMYNPSYTMPLGITFGVLNENKLGGYLSFKSNLGLETTDVKCNNTSIPNLNSDSYYRWDDSKWNNYMFTAGILYPIFNNLSASLGIGYAKRDAFWHAVQCNYTTDMQTASNWYHNTQSSYNGTVLELGALYKHNRFIFSGGCNTISFKDLDIYIGIGYVFND